MKRLHFILFGLFVFAVWFGLSFQTNAQIENGIIQTADENRTSPNIVISQFYGGGGVATASPFRNDFVELFNRSNAPVSINGYSIQFSFAGSSTWNITPLPNATIAPGQYFLVQFAQSADGSGAPLPASDATGTTNMHPINGKLAVVNTTTALSGACPTGTGIVDFLGYGTGGCFEGTAPVTGMGITVAAKRNGTGCFDTDQNSTDFTVATPTPRNTATTPANCGTIEIPLSANGAANPNVAAPSATVLFTVRVTPADTPPSTGITVRGDLSSVGGAANQAFFDDNTNGDTTAGDNIFSYSYVIPNLFGGSRTIPAVAADAQGRTANTSIFLNINAPFEGDNHILLGNPSGATPDVANENNYLMFKPQYVLSYNRSRATANWVSWRLDSSWIGTAERQDDFRPDPALPASWYQVSTTDYTGSGYDRGHMTPSGDRTRSVADNSATFLMTNIIPQLAANNQGAWEDFESYCRTQAQIGQEIYIVSGVVGNIGTISQGRVVIPQYTWKVALFLSNGADDLQRVTNETRTVGIIVPNFPPLNINATWREFLFSVDQVENLTGYDFFSNVPAATQAIIESRVDGAPTAATVSINGRVTTPQQTGLTNALVTLTDERGNSRTILSGKSGAFSFTEVAAGETYILSVRSKRYRFAAQVITPSEDLTGLTLMPQASDAAKIK